MSKGEHMRTRGSTSRHSHSALMAPPRLGHTRLSMPLTPCLKTSQEHVRYLEEQVLYAQDGEMQALQREEALRSQLPAAEGPTPPPAAAADPTVVDALREGLERLQLLMQPLEGGEAPPEHCLRDLLVLLQGVREQLATAGLGAVPVKSDARGPAAVRSWRCTARIIAEGRETWRMAWEEAQAECRARVGRLEHALQQSRVEHTHALEETRRLPDDLGVVQARYAPSCVLFPLERPKQLGGTFVTTFSASLRTPSVLGSLCPALVRSIGPSLRKSFGLQQQRVKEKSTGKEYRCEMTVQSNQNTVRSKQ